PPRTRGRPRGEAAAPAEPARARLGGAAEGGVLLRQLLVEPAVRLTLGLRPGDRLLEQSDGFVCAPERAQRLADRVAREPDLRGLLGPRLARLESAPKGRERGLVLAAAVVLPAEVVLERAEPVAHLGVVGFPRELHCAPSPADDRVVIGRGERRHVRGVDGDEGFACGERDLECPLEERQGSTRIARRPQQSAPLERDPRGEGRTLVPPLLRLGEEPLAGREVAAQPFDPRELRQHLGSIVAPEERAEASFGRVEVAEVPERAEAIAHQPATPSITLRPLPVGVAPRSDKPALASSASYSSSVRSRPPGATSMVRSENFPSGPSFGGASTRSTTSNVPFAPSARRQLSRICRACSSSQSWTIDLSRYASEPGGTASKKLP